MFKIHQISGHIQSIYLVEYKEKLLLLDCATRADFNKIKDFIEKNLNRSFSDIKLAIVSHMHPDHAGLAGKLQNKYKIPVLTHPLAVKWYKGIGGNLQHTVDVFLAWYVAAKHKKPPRRMWYPAKVYADYLAEDNNPLPFFEDWKVIYTPGHTSHDISLYNPDTQTIYLADVVLHIKNKYVLPMPVTLPQMMKKTLNKLSGIKIKTILLAHGGQLTLDNSKQFFSNLSKMIDAHNENMPTFVKKLSFFPPCIKNIENC